MNVYLDNRYPSPALGRVTVALQRHAPRGISFVDNDCAADIVVLYVIGRHDHLARYLDALHKPYALIQIALRSTRNPNTADWLELWQGARLVWSYYDLPYHIEQDGLEIPTFHFYHAPLGADPSVFSLKNLPRQHIVEINGTVGKAECHAEIIKAAAALDKKVAHFGVAIPFHPAVYQYGHVTDLELARIHNQCVFISGLRRKDGFEMACAEGL